MMVFSTIPKWFQARKKALFRPQATASRAVAALRVRRSPNIYEPGGSITNALASGALDHSKEIPRIIRIRQQIKIHEQIRVLNPIPHKAQGTEILDSKAH